MNLVQFPNSKIWHGSSGFVTYCGISFYDRRNKVRLKQNIPARLTTDPEGPCSHSQTCGRCFE